MAIDLYNPVMNQSFFSEEQIEKLSSHLEESRIKERKGGGGKLKYLSADDEIGVANEIFGYGRWGYEVIARGHEMVEDPKKGGPMHMYTADIKLYVVGCPFPFPGDGVGIVNDPYTVEIHEKARKEATSDALKRALRHYGDQFGLCLYDKDDMVESSDGTLVPVKDAKVGGPKQPAKRVVDSEKQPPTSKELYQGGLGILWNTSAQFFVEISKRCNIQNVTRDTTLSVEHKWLLARAIEEAKNVDAVRLETA